MRLLFDEDFNLRIVRGLLRRVEDLEWRSANEFELRGKTDEGILLIAAAEKRIVVSHDVNTMTATFQTLEAAGHPLPGLLLVPQRMPIGDAITELLLICVATDAPEWTGRMVFLPL